MEADYDNSASAGHASPRRARLRPREIAAIVALLIIVGVLAAVVIHGPSKAPLPNNVSSAQSSSFAGLVLTPIKPAPPLALPNYLGDPVNIANYRGKAVLVTFLYAHCPDVCPLITANLHTAVRELGSKASEVQVIAVSVDPHGDTRSAVAQFVRLHEMTGRMKYLIGSVAALGRTWQAWNVGSQRDAGKPELVAHTALVYGISGHGNLMTIYPANFSPREIVEDVPKLAAS
jgi:protein SCO1/2